MDNSDGSHEDISQISEQSGRGEESVVKVKNQYELYMEIYEISSRQHINSIIDSLYTDKERFYLFLSLVCKHVITRMRWRREKVVNPYYEFITESDEAFALIILDNNYYKYRDMVRLGMGNKDQWESSKYTTTHKNKLGSRRWCTKAKSKFFYLTQAIREWRENNGNQMKELATYVLDKYKTSCEYEKIDSYWDNDETTQQFIKESMLMSTSINRKRKRMNTKIEEL